MFRLGIEVLLEDQNKIQELKGRRVAVIGHPASVSSDLTHTLDRLVAHPDIHLTSAFGPQHGMLGDLQDNMCESEDYIHPVYKIPIFSLYGEVRRPTDKMLDTFDVILVDMQDVGTRIYTYLTTLFYLLEDCAKSGKTIWVLDRPNPAGRAVEGFTLSDGWYSFVGAADVPIRTGITLGEAARWYKNSRNIDVDLDVIAMQGYEIESSPWPKSLSWVNPSPNIPRVTATATFPGTVLLEGTNLSEGRGTTLPLEVVGAPDIDCGEILNWMNENVSDWIKGCHLRHYFFQPTFHKHQGQTCNGLQIHCEDQIFKTEEMRPFRLMAGFFRALRELYPDYKIWRDFHYEYEKDRLAIDLINGGPQLREFVDQRTSLNEFDSALRKDESDWIERRREFLLY